MAKSSPAKENTRPYSLKAVIDVGSTSIRMALAQIHEDGHFQVLDSMHQSVAIGSDTFTRGRISRDTIEDCVKVLRNFSAVLAEYNIDLRTDVRAVATSAVWEARNREEFLDRLLIATDITVEVIEGAEVNRLTFLGIQPMLQKNEALQKNRLLVAEVGGGTTELLGFQDGRVSFAHSYRMGAYRLREIMDALHASEARQLEVLEMEIKNMMRQFQEAVGGTVSGKPRLLLMGGEARFAAGKLLGDRDENQLAELKVSELAKLADRIVRMDAEQVVRKYHLAQEEAQTLGPALQVYVRTAAAFQLKRLYVCDVSLRDGLLTEAASGNAWSEDFIAQILHSAREVGRRYLQDEQHAVCVTENARSLFRALQEEHRLEFRYEVILTVAAMLHDIGTFINVTSHHKHSKYLIENSDIFGLGEEDIKLVALTARYHRRAFPRATHLDYNALTRSKRLVVTKLAAILRVADALDRSHTQGISNIKVRLNDGKMVIEAGQKGDFAAERRALAGKSGMFEQVYGRSVVLRSGRG